MFTVGYQKGAMLIKSLDEKEINHRNINELKHLIIQLMQNPYQKIILDLKHIRHVEPQTLEALKNLAVIAGSKNVSLSIINNNNISKEILLQEINN